MHLCSLLNKPALFNNNFESAIKYIPTKTDNMTPDYRSRLIFQNAWYFEKGMLTDTVQRRVMKIIKSKRLIHSWNGILISVHAYNTRYFSAFPKRFGHSCESLFIHSTRNFRNNHMIHEPIELWNWTIKMPFIP